MWNQSYLLAFQHLIYNLQQIISCVELLSHLVLLLPTNHRSTARTPTLPNFMSLFFKPYIHDCRATPLFVVEPKKSTSLNTSEFLFSKHHQFSIYPSLGGVLWDSHLSMPWFSVARSCSELVLPSPTSAKSWVQRPYHIHMALLSC